MAAKKKPVVKPTNIVDLVSNLGITPGPSNAVQKAQIVSSRNSRMPTVAPVGRTAQARRTIGVAPTERGHAAVQGFLQSDFGGLAPKPSSEDGAWDMIKGGFMKALEIVDVPRSYVVSAAKELGDIGNNFLDEHASFIPHFSGDGEQGSWDEFTSQAKDHIGYQDVVHDVSKMNQTGNWYDLDNIIGFAGDAIADPTTYIGVGGTTGIAKESADAALNAAVHSGGRSAVGKAVKDAAERAFPASVFEAGEQGVQEVLKRNIPREVDRLIVDAANRGRGGITRQAIKRAGLTTEQQILLDLPELGRGVFGKMIPGSRRIAETVENLKGGIKAGIGGTNAASKARGFFLGDRFSSRKLIDVIRDEGASTETRAMAVQVLGESNRAAAEANGWATRKAKEVFGKGSPLAAAIDGAEKTDFVRWADEIETAAQGAVLSPEAQALSDFFGGTLQDARGLGVDVAERANYFPHQVTREAWDLARDNPELKKIIENVSDVEGFQKARAGTDTILQANSKFMAEHGVNLFETDPRVVMIRYMGDVTDSIGRAVQQKAIQRMGLSEIIPEYAHVAQVAQEDLERLGKSRSKAALQATDSLDRLIHTRSEQVQIATQALKEQKRSLLGELRRADQEVISLGRAKNTADKELSLASSRLDTARDALTAHRKNLTGARGELKSSTRATIRQLENDLKTTEAAFNTAKGRVDDIMSNYSSSASFSLTDRAQASKGFVAETKRLSEGRAELQAQHENATVMLESLKLKNTPPGAGDTLADVHVRTSTDAVASLETITNARSKQAALATGVYDMAVADQTVVQATVDQSLATIKDAQAKLLTSPGKAPKKNLAKKLQFAQDINDSLAAAKHVLQATDDPGFQLIARLDATAAMADLEALQAGSVINHLDDIKGQLMDPKFRTYFEQEISKGFKKLGETNHQIPDWLDQALTIEEHLRRPGAWEDIVKTYDKFQNLWKGYAVARPGFAFRNAYSSFFNVYLEGGLSAFDSITKYGRFSRMMSANPESYMDDAIRAWGPETAQMLEDARKAASATGAGQAASEVATDVLDKSSKNPFNPSFAPIKAIRKASGKIEDVVRGGHAFDVLARGGSLDLAVDTVTKWHFDYAMLSQADDIARRAMPFWTFFSRNMVLQASTFPQILPKLNRSYFNAARNLSNGENPDTNVPDYYSDASAIRLPGMSSKGDVSYLFPDVAPTQFVSDVNNLVSSKGGSLLGNLGPLPKMAFQQASGQDAFTGRPFQDWDNPKAMPFYDTVGITPILSALGLTREGGTSGNDVTTDRTISMLENLLPTVGQGRRLTDSDSGKPGLQQFLSWLGVSTRTNTDRMRDNMDKSAYYDALDAARREERLRNA